MKLRETTRKIISQLEEISGYSVQVVEDKNLPVPASLRVARGHLPAHILSFNALHGSSLDFIICWHCALALRLFQRDADQRFQIASSPESSQRLDAILFAPNGVVHRYGLDPNSAASLRDQLIQGLIVHLYSIAVGLRVSDKLTLDYPELLEFESAHVEKELQANLSGLAEQVRQTLPREVFEATHKINTAFALYWSRRLEKPEIVNPYRSHGFEPAGVELLKVFERIPNDVVHDYELVDEWGSFLGIRDWYIWTKYEGAK